MRYIHFHFDKIQKFSQFLCTPILGACVLILGSSILLKATCLALILIHFLAACTTIEKVDCSSTNWYELGRQKGSSGLLGDDFQNQVSHCSNENTTRFADLYLMGYKAGLASFCTEDNAFTMGKTGASYNHVCPLHLEEDFMTYYNKGLKIYDLQRSNVAINYELESLLQQISLATNSQLKINLNNRVSQLKREKIQNDQKIKQYSEIF